MLLEFKRSQEQLFPRCKVQSESDEISERSSRTSHAELRDLTYITSKVFVFSFVLFSGFDFLSSSLLVIESFVEYGEGFTTKERGSILRNKNNGRTK